MILETINSPADVKRLSEEDAVRLCQELRRFLVEQVSRTGGHLASNLGVVELTVAIHRVYDTASDRLVLDVGHQCYVHKALTGRRELFGTLRQFGGLSGFPKPYESVHDAFSKREGLSRACAGSYNQRLIERVDAFQLTRFESHNYAPRFAQEKSGQKRQASLVDGLA